MAGSSKLLQQRDRGVEEMERVRRVELPTLCLASIRSSQLSYTRLPIHLQQATGVVNFRPGCGLTGPVAIGKTECGN